MSESVSRPVWMSTRGAEIYENWNAALLNTCDTPTFWDEYAASLDESAPNANTVYFGLRRLINNPEPSIFFAQSDTWSGLINRWDLAAELSETYLEEYQAEILHYTSAQDMARKFKITSNDPDLDIKKVILHAWDGLQFGLGFPAAVAGDTYFATHNIGPERKSTEGHWQKRTQFISEALRNPSFIASMEELRVTGVVVLTDNARLDMMPREAMAVG